MLQYLTLIGPSIIQTNNLGCFYISLIIALAIFQKSYEQLYLVLVFVEVVKISLIFTGGNFEKLKKRYCIIKVQSNAQYFPRDRADAAI